jgi:RNA polymerase sigma-70 factor (ECF subfamily)
MDRRLHPPNAAENAPLEPAAPDRLLEPHDGASFEEFASANYERLFGAVCLVTGDRFDAEEITQEALVRVLEGWDRVREMADPQAYLFRTALNVFRSRFRRARLALLRAFAPRPTPDAFAAVEDKEVVVRGLRRVSANQRAALVATALLGYSSEEAARILGTTPSNVRARSTRARAALREAIGEFR